MKKVYQTNTTRSRGNCLQAAIASFLDIEDLDEVPYFSSFVWREALARYFFDHYGKIVSSMQSTSLKHQRRITARLDDGFCLVSVESMTHPNTLHAVVGEITDGSLKIVHDPNPKNKGRSGDDYFVFEIFTVN